MTYKSIGRQVDRTPITGLFWSKEFDGKSIFDLMEQWPKMPYAHIKMVIINEGGFIDDKGIIHKGITTVEVGTIE